MMRAGPAAEPATEMNERFPNRYLGDTSQRIATDISQMVGIRFGETIRAHVERSGTAASLTGEALAIAGPGAVRATLKKYLTAT